MTRPAATIVPARYGVGTWQWVGLVGSLIIATGGVLAGVAPARDPLLAVTGVSELRGATVFATAIVYVGLTLLLVAWWNCGNLVRSLGGPSVGELLRTGAWWALPFALISPVFSGDLYSYLAQGAMRVAGMDAYKFGPALLGGRLAENVPPIWQHTATPYGPVFLGLSSGVAKMINQNTWPGIVAMRVLALLGVALIAWAVPRLASSCGVSPTSAVWLGVINPVVLLHLVADAHNDALMLGLLTVGLVLALRGRPWLSVIMITLSGLVKAPGALGIAFVVPIWTGHLIGRYRWLRATGGALLAATATTVVLTLMAGTGYGWVSALNTPTLARTWMSITTDLGWLFGEVMHGLGLATVDQTRHAFWLAGLVAAGVLIVILLHRSTQIGVVAALGLALTALVVLGPVVHPWYLLWGLVPLAASGSARVRRGVAILSAALVLLVLPGGVPPGLPALMGACIGIAVAFAALAAFGYPERNEPWTLYESRPLYASDPSEPAGG